MSEELQEFEGVEELPEHDLMSIFDELTFSEKWSKVFNGIKMPKETGEYKFAKLQMIRLSAPVSAVVVPILMFLLIAVLNAFAPEPDQTFQLDIMEVTPMEELEIPEEPEIEPPEPVDVEFSDAPVTPSEVVSPPEDYSPMPAEFDAVAQIKSPVIMKGMYGSRSPGARGSLLGRHGGGNATEGAVMRALRWLKVNQDEAGSWGKDKPAMTALVVLAYLAHGETPSSPEFGYTVEKALQYLLSAQTADGKFKGGDGHEYTTPIVAYALSEAYGLTQVPQLHDAAKKSVRRVIKGQNAVGGFNYGLKGPTDTRNDLSYIAWCVQSLKAAKMAYVEVDGLDKAMTRSVAGVKANYGARGDYGGFAYSSPGATGLTGAGILCLQFLGEGKSKEVQNALAGTAAAVCAWDKEKIDNMHHKDPLYYWYYLTQAKFQAGGATWDSWNKQCSPMLVKNQVVISKEASGYLDHTGAPRSIGHWSEGVPGAKVHGGTQNGVFPTVLCTLMLEVYYRYLPTFKAPTEVIEEEVLDDDDDDLDIDIVQSLPAVRRRDDLELALTI
jgi:hypothetical protein